MRLLLSIKANHSGLHGVKLTKMAAILPWEWNRLTGTRLGCHGPPPQCHTILIRCIKAKSKKDILSEIMSRSRIWRETFNAIGRQKSPVNLIGNPNRIQINWGIISGKMNTLLKFRIIFLTMMIVRHMKIKKSKFIKKSRCWEQCRKWIPGYWEYLENNP